MCIVKRGLSFGYIALVFLVVSIISLGLVRAITFIPVGDNTKLATVVNGTIISSEEIQNYLKSYNYFTDLNYDTLSPGETKEYTLLTGGREDNLRGIEIEGKRYAIHLVLCHWGEQKCYFKINGVPSGGQNAFQAGVTNNSSQFTIGSGFKLRVEAIQWDYCENKRFCNLKFEASNIVNLSFLK